MKILQVFDSISKIGGGSQMAMISWSLNLIKLGENVKVLTNDKAYTPDGFKKENFIFSKGFNLGRFYPQYSFGILTKNSLEKISDFGPDIIHVHEPSILTYQIVNWAKAKKIPSLVTFHTNFRSMKVNKFPANLIFGENLLANKLVPKLQSKIIENANYISSPTNYYKKILSKRFGQTIFITEYPISSLFFEQSSKTSRSSLKTKKLISIGRLSGEKNVDILISMMKLLDSSFRLTIIGDGIDKNTLQKKAKNTGVLEKLSFEGWIANNQLPNILRNHHIFVSASSFETFGITYIEALACEIPVVVYDYPVAKEVVPKEMGIFIPSLSPLVWAESLTQIFRDMDRIKDLRGNISKNYQLIQKYEEENSTRNLLKVYNDIL